MHFLNFRGLPVLKTWLIFGLGVNRPGDLDLWPSDLYIGSRVTRVMGFLRFNFQVPLPFRSRLSVNHVTDGQTDSTTNINALCPHAMGAGHNKRLFADLRTPNCVYGLQKNQNRHTTEKKNRVWRSRQRLPVLAKIIGETSVYRSPKHFA